MEPSLGKAVGVWTAILMTAALLAPAAAEPKLPLPEQAGQMIMVGFEGSRATDKGFLEVRRDLEAGRIGGVLFLGHNIGSAADVREMTRLLKACRCRLPPLIAVDEEGGWVERLGARQGFNHTPSASRVARQGPEEASRIYDALAAEVARAGFNLNLAPVVDLDSGRSNPIIGRIGRSFSGKPDIVAEFARVFVRSHRKAGVLTSLKHFPGHGSSVTDTHEAYADVTTTWKKSELQPYRALLEQGLVDTVMIGHISSNRWSGVASLSPSDAISGLLRKELGFDGVVLADDLDMGAVAQNSPDFGKRIERAVLAGNDILIVSNHVARRSRIGARLQGILLSGLEESRIEPALIEASFRRIAALKKTLRERPAD